MNKRLIAEGILFTDQYQLTMAQLFFNLGMHEKQAQYDHFFRSYPDYGAHQAGYCVNAGLDWLLDWMEAARFGEAEIERMRGTVSRTGRRVFGDDFLAWLRASGNFDGISLQAIPEGRVVHAHVPLTVVRGPLAMAQILETPLLNILNYQTLIATKAARLRESAGDALVLRVWRAPISILMSACCWWTRSIRWRAACPTRFVSSRGCARRATHRWACAWTPAIWAA
jgi:nicotinate phosphoribosyltransferase